MKVAIMQPYFFPYIGYFQLINSVDIFVIYDDVNFINRGWINRNYILSSTGKLRVTLQLESASQNKLINQINVGDNKVKILRTLQLNYARAPFFKTVYPMLETILMSTDKNLAIFLMNSLKVVCNYLGIHTQWILSSELEKDNLLKGQDKILNICRNLGADEYINLPGGKEIYDPASFAKDDTKLFFIAPKIVSYQQSISEFIPYLSIIDVMMYNSQHECQRMLEDYELV